MSFAVFVSLIDFLPMLDSFYLPVIGYCSKHVRPCESALLIPRLSKTRAIDSDAITQRHPLFFGFSVTSTLALKATIM
jgi:hypothetical protein